MIFYIPLTPFRVGFCYMCNMYIDEINKMIYIPKKLPRRCIAPYVYIVAGKKNKLTIQELLQDMNYENTQYNRRCLNKYIMEIIDLGILSGKQSELNTYIFNKEGLKLKPGEYYICDFNNIKQVLNIKDKCNRIDLAGYYGILCSTINHKTKVGSCFISKLCDISGLNKSTVLKYNKILEDNKLIYMIHSTTKGKPNYYGMADDFDCVVKEAYKAGVFIPEDIFKVFINHKQLY